MSASIDTMCLSLVHWPDPLFLLVFRLGFSREKRRKESDRESHFLFLFLFFLLVFLFSLFLFIHARAFHSFDDAEREG